MTWYGVTIKAGKSASGVQEFLVLGDLNLANNDILTATDGSTRAMRLIIAGDSNIAQGATIDVSGKGAVAALAAGAAV